MKILTLAIAWMLAGALHAQDVAWARDLYVHGLKGRAMEVYIGILHTASLPPEAKAEALYYMGQISFEDGSFATALNDWQKLVADYPDSPRAAELKDRFTQLQEVYSKVADPPIDSVVARSYIKNGDFWAGGERKFSVETSVLPNIDLGVAWYDRVIHEFPGTEAADLAMQRKVFLWLGFVEADYPRNAAGTPGCVRGLRGGISQGREHAGLPLPDLAGLLAPRRLAHHHHVAEQGHRGSRRQKHLL